MDILTPDEIRLNNIRNQVKGATDKNALVKGLLLSTGYYTKIVEYVPELIMHLLSTERGRELLEKMGLNELIKL